MFCIANRTKKTDYGYEEGHGEDNEVRKEKFFRKRNPQRKVHDWRRKHNLHPQALAWGPWSQKADWSFESGDPGVLNAKQQQLMTDNIRLAEEVHQAALLVLKAKQFEK